MSGLLLAHGVTFGGYGHVTLRKCPQCHELKPMGKRAKYCGDACKQAAYRQRLDPLSGTTARRNMRAQNGARTKRNTTVKYNCAQCGRETYRSGAEGARLYCDDACKQAAYRARKAGSKS